MFIKFFGSILITALLTVCILHGSVRTANYCYNKAQTQITNVVEEFDWSDHGRGYQYRQNVKLNINVYPGKDQGDTRFN